MGFVGAERAACRDRIAAGAAVERARDAADRRHADAGALVDLAIRHALLQQRHHHHALCENQRWMCLRFMLLLLPLMPGGK